MKSKIAAVLAIFSTVAYVDSVNTDTTIIEKQIKTNEVRNTEPVVEYTLEENKAKIKYGINEIKRIDATKDEVEKARMTDKFIRDMGMHTTEFQKKFMSGATYQTSTQTSVSPMEMPRNYGNKNLLNQLESLESQAKTAPEFNNKARIANRPKMTYRA